MLELYNQAQSTCSQKVRMVLAEKNLEWVDRQISFQTHEHLSDWYLKINPNGVVPTLLHDGEIVRDSSVINEYLDAVFPHNPLRPRNELELARMREWRQYIDEVPTPAIRIPTFNVYFERLWGAMTPEEFERHTAKMPLRRHFYRRMGPKGFSEEDLREAIEQLEQTLERMERSLERTQWLANDAFTLADLSMLPSIVRLEDIALSRLWQGLPRVTDWYRRIQQRPSFAITYYPASRTTLPAC
jgi:glutathione S-transferase